MVYDTLCWLPMRFFVGDHNFIMFHMADMEYFDNCPTLCSFFLDLFQLLTEYDSIFYTKTILL